MRDLGVKLHAEDRSLLVPERADWISIALRGHPIALGRLLDVIPVTHPRRHRLVSRESGEQPARLQHFHLCAPVLTPICPYHLPALDVGDQLHSVTDAEDRSDVEDGGIGERDVVAVDRVGSAAEDYSGWLPLADPLNGSTRRVDLGIHPRFADPPGDQLRELGAEIDDEDPAAHRVMFSTSPESVFRIIAVHLPWIQPHASPGLMTIVLPIFFSD